MQQLRSLSLPDFTLLTTTPLLLSLQTFGLVCGTVSISLHVLSPRWFHQSSREDFPLLPVDCCCSLPYFFHSCSLCRLCECFGATLTCRSLLTTSCVFFTLCMVVSVWVMCGVIIVDLYGYGWVLIDRTWERLWRLRILSFLWLLCSVFCTWMLLPMVWPLPSSNCGDLRSRIRESNYHLSCL